MGGEALEHGKEEGRRLAGAGAGHGDHVVAAHDERDRLPLDGRRHAVPAASSRSALDLPEWSGRADLDAGALFPSCIRIFAFMEGASDGCGTCQR